MRRIKKCFTVSIVFFLLSCVSAPAVTSIAVPSSTLTTQVLPGSRTPPPSPTVVPTQTIDPSKQKALTGVEALLPPGSQPLFNQAWFRSADGKFSSTGFLPYLMDAGLGLLAVGNPRQEDGVSTGSEPIRIWDWKDSGLEPKSWQEILPIDVGDSRGLSSFLGRDQNGQWWAVMSTINWSIPELVLLGVFPIVSKDDVQIEPVSLSPIEDNADLTQFLVRTNERLILYEVKGNQPGEIWSTDRVMQGRFHVHSYANPVGSVDMSNDGYQELLVVWELNFPPLIDAYQFVKDGSEVLHWLGRLDSSLQYTDINGDGAAELLRPDNPETPSEWQVIAWYGDIFKESSSLLQPPPVTSSPVAVNDVANLPRLPSDIVFQNRGSQEWLRWSQAGGLPEKMNDPDYHLYDNCSPQMYGGYGDACYSPAGRYKLIDMPSGIEGSDTGIFDGVTGNKVRIPGSFVYAEGYLTFAWSPDESFLLFAQGEGVAKLSKVDPVSGEKNTIFDYSLCGLDFMDCQHFSADAVTDPAVFEDGSLGFAIQSFDPSLYPPPGIYRMSPRGELTMLADLPFIDKSKGSFANLHPYTLIYGRLLWSPDKSMFLFYDLFVGDKTGVRTLLLGKADGSALWDLRDAFPDVYEFRWD